MAIKLVTLDEQKDNVVNSHIERINDRNVRLTMLECGRGESLMLSALTAVTLPFEMADSNRQELTSMYKHQMDKPLIFKICEVILACPELLTAPDVEAKMLSVDNPDFKTLDADLRLGAIYVADEFMVSYYQHQREKESLDL